jgi:hypothetical protein
MPRGADIVPENTGNAPSPSANREGLRQRLPETRKAQTSLPKYISPVAAALEKTRKKKELQIIGTKEKDSSLTYGRMVVEALRGTLLGSVLLSCPSAVFSLSASSSKLSTVALAFCAPRILSFITHMIELTLRILFVTPACSREGQVHVDARDPPVCR